MMGLVPTETRCLSCSAIFLQPTRRQGGGARQKYCSKKCAQFDWTLGHKGKRQAAVLKYDSKPENKVQKQQRARRLTLAKYGWTEADFQHQLARQNGACYGCLGPIDATTARVDHDHEAEQVRGLLCDSCNWALGHAKDNVATLRRLMAYLDHQRTKLNVYLIGALKNQRIPVIGNLLRVQGYDVMDEWFTPGEYADTNWQAYERLRGRTYAEALRGRAATNIVLFDRSYLDHSDAVVYIAPAGKSAMLELGYAAGSGKRTAIFLDGEEPDRYDIMPGLAQRVMSQEAQLLQWLDEVRLEIVPDKGGATT